MVLECALKNVIVGDSAGPLVSTCSPATALSSAPAERVTGSVRMTSLFSTVSRFALWTSTTGVSPVTVIVSASAPTFRSALTVATNDPVSSIPSRLTVLKPGSVNVTSYVPGRRSIIRYWPVPSVTAGFVFFIRARGGASAGGPRRAGPGGTRDGSLRGGWG